MDEQSVTKTINTMKNFVQRELNTGKEGVIIQGYPPDCNIVASGPTFNAIMNGYRNFAASTAKVWFVDPRNGLPGHPMLGQPCKDSTNVYRIEEDNSHPTPFSGELMALAIADIIRKNSDNNSPTAPVPNPTPAPVVAPTAPSPTACVDSSSFQDKKGKTRTCAWAGKKAKRCRLYGEHCPVICGICQAPIPSPTAPVPSPTQTPVSSPTSPSEPVCFDRTLAFRNKKNRDCSWVAAKTNKRCNKQWQGKALWEWCPSACGLECSECCEVTAWECEENQDEAECNAAFETCTQTC